VNSNPAEEIGREQRDLNAYHDGELSGLRRWLFERQLSRSPRLRAELEELRRLARWVQGAGVQPPSVDVWDGIALRLPAIDAESVEQRQRRVEQRQRGAEQPQRPDGQPQRLDGHPRRRDEQREWRGMGWLAAYSRPLTAAAVTAALALALFLGIMEEAAPPTPGIIRWLDTGGRSVMVLEDQGDATIVWLLDALEDGISEGGSREAV
jgi:anti-sigma factor RsiW